VAKYNVKILDRYADYDFEKENNHYDAAIDILNHRHHVRGGKGNYEGLSDNLVGDSNNLYDYIKLFKTRKKMEFIKLAKKEVDILVMAYQQTNDSLIIEGLFEHFFTYIQTYSKKYNYVSFGINENDGDFMSIGFTVLDKCAKNYKLGNFMVHLTNWLRFSFYEACRTQYYNVVKVSKSELAKVLRGENERVKSVASIDGGSVILADWIDKSEEFEDYIVYRCDYTPKKVLDAMKKIIGETNTLIFCLNEGVYTENNVRYSYKEISNVLGINTSSIARRKNASRVKLERSKFFKRMYKAFYGKTKK